MAATSLIMVVDDEPKIGEFIRHVLAEDGREVVDTTDPEAALQRLDECLPDLLLVDLKMPKMDGLTFIEEAKKHDPSLPIMMITAYGTIPTAVEALRRGACDFIEKPFDLHRLRSAVDSALNNRSLRREVIRLRDERRSRFGELGSAFICASPRMAAIYRMVKQVAKSPTTTVLIQGESGTGKELIARAIHLASERKDARFVDINCAALSDTLLEAELFGYEKGAFTGAATTGKPGLFEVAHGGTVFLDEIGEMSLSLQAKLLRVLQERRFMRVGGVEDVKVDVRVIASTNRDLEQLVAEGKFRLDLYYRVGVVPIHVPPLRERREDIYPIALHYVDRFATAMDKKIKGITPEARAILESHSWPGNVRELKNVMERAVILCTGEYIGEESLLLGGNPNKSKARIELEMKNLSLAEMEKQLIRKVLERTSWRRTQAARILGINRTTLYNKIREYDLSPSHG